MTPTTQCVYRVTDWCDGFEGIHQPVCGPTESVRSRCVTGSVPFATDSSRSLRPLLTRLSTDSHLLRALDRALHPYHLPVHERRRSQRLPVARSRRLPTARCEVQQMQSSVPSHSEVLTEKLIAHFNYYPQRLRMPEDLVCNATKTPQG